MYTPTVLITCEAPAPLSWRVQVPLPQVSAGNYVTPMYIPPISASWSIIAAMSFSWISLIVNLNAGLSASWVIIKQEKYFLQYNQWPNCGGTWGNGVPLPFWRGNAVPLAYTMTATYNTSNRKNVR